MWKRKIPLTRILTLSSPNSNIPSQNFCQVQLQKNMIYLKWATTINPRNFKAKIDLADSLFKLGRDNEAFSSIKKGLSLEPEHYESQYLHVFLIEALKKKQRLGEYESITNEIANMIADPKSVPYFYLTSAEALKYENLFPQALSAYGKALKDGSPFGCDEHYAYGLLFYQEGFFEEALAQFEQVKKLGPSQNEDETKLLEYVVPAWTKAAYLNYCLGRVQKAKEEFDHIVANKLETPLTYTDFFLVLHHISENGKMMNFCKEGIKKIADRWAWGEEKPDKIYEKDKEKAEKILEKDDIDQKKREFNTKRLEGIKALLLVTSKATERFEWERMLSY